MMGWHADVPVWQALERWAGRKYAPGWAPTV